MLGFNGGLLGKQNRPTSAVLGASGVWLPNEQSVAERLTQWPLGPNTLPAIGGAFGGGYLAGYISHTANGVATHALIVAPRATGASGTGYPVTTNYAYKTTQTTTVNAASLFDGVANTAAIVASGIALHPAAQFCVNLSIGGYTDWYLPSVLELDIAYNNLKPDTTSNSTSVGINNYSVPQRLTNYTTTVPGQTTVGAFQATGSEFFSTSTSVYHASSTDFSSVAAYVLRFSNGDRSTSFNKASASYSVRAFRRITL